MKDIFNETSQVEDEAQLLMDSIDWDKNAELITDSIGIKRFKPPTASRGFSLRTLSWKLAVPALTCFFLMGIWLGYLMFSNAPTTTVPSDLVPGQDISLARLENTLARKEMAGYFKQSQVLLTDLMRQCDDTGTSGPTDGLNIRRVKTLLNKNHYLSRDITDPQLLSSRKLLKKIEWLLYEMVSMEEGDGTDCNKLQQLQDYIRQERLLLKLRLVGKDINYSEI